MKGRGNRMYEKLDKIRGDLAKAKQRRDEADTRVKALEDKLQEAENSQVLADVSALKLTPEQVAQFLQLAASGQLPMNNGTGVTQFENVTQIGKTADCQKYDATDENENEGNDNFEEDMEDYDNEK